MRLSLFLCCLITWGFTPTGSSAQNPDILVNKGGEKTLKEVFKMVNQQTGYTFIFRQDIVDANKKVDLEKGVVRFKSLLNRCLGDELTYRLTSNTVVVTKNQIEVSVQDNRKIIKGKVTDEKGNILPGVSVVISGTNTGVATDIDGNFNLKLNKGDVLVFSFVGMITKNIKFTGQEVINIVLKADAQQMEEVVVTGFQRISKERVSGSYKKVANRHIEKPTSNISDNIVGTLAGLQLINDGSGETKFEIRGQSSLTTEYGEVSRPLIVVDGFPVEGGLDNLNPNDIESITVLKDAAAASIWGARSGNGVIVVTTYRAQKRDNSKVEISSFLKIQQKPDYRGMLNRLSSAEQIALEKYTFTTKNKYGSLGYIFPSLLPQDNVNYISSISMSESQTALMENYFGNISDDERDKVLGRLSKMDNLKQIEENLVQTNITQQHNIAISGANSKMNNRLSLMIEDNRGDAKKNEIKRYTANYKINYKVLKNLSFNFSSTFNYIDNKYTGSNSRIYGMPGNPLSFALGTAPYQMLKNPDGSLNRWTNGHNIFYQIFSPSSSQIYKPNFDRYLASNEDVVKQFPYQDWTYNPIEELNSRKYNSKSINARFQAGIDLKILKGLDFSSKYQYEFYDENITERYMEDSFEVRMRVNSTCSWDKTTNKVIQNLPKGEFFDKAKREVRSYNFRNQLNFDKTFNDHTLTALLGTEISQRTQNIFAQPRIYGYDNMRMSSKPLPNGDGSKLTGVHPSAIFNMYGILPLNNMSMTPSIVGLKSLEFIEGYRTNSSFGYMRDVYFSLYGNMAYSYKGKYTLTASARTDASNFIADDPKYRYSPFWSVGGIWLIGREDFFKNVHWLDALSLKMSYGVNGNANKGSVAKTVFNISPNIDPVTGSIVSSIGNYGNPALAWEEIRTMNMGTSFSILNRKLYGNIEYYNKISEELVCNINVPSFTGTSGANINAASLINKGIEIELGSNIPIVGINIAWSGNLNFAYNKNEITHMLTKPAGVNDLINGGYKSYLEGYSANSLWTQKYAGLDKNGLPLLYDKEGKKYSAIDTWNLAGDPINYSFYQGVTIAPYNVGFNTNFKIYNFDLSLMFTGKFGHKFKRSTFRYILPYINSSVSKTYNETVGVDPDKMMPTPTEEYNSQFVQYMGVNHMDYMIEDASHIRFREISLSYSMNHFILERFKLSQFKLYGRVNNIGTILFNDYKEDPEYGFGKLPMAFTLGFKCSF